MSISKYGRRLPPAKRDALIADYLAGMTTGGVAAKYGVCSCSAWELLRRRGLTRGRSLSHRRYSLNESAFDSITEQSAYWVGMLITDGCIWHPNTGSPSVRLALKKSDAEHVAAFLLFLGSNQPVSFALPQVGNQEGAAIAAPCSQRLVKALAAYGVLPRKTHTAAVAHLEHDRHFWRGAIDGDGSVYVAGNGRPVVSLVSASHVFMEQYRTFVKSVCPECRAGINGPRRSVYSFAVSGPAALKLVTHLYADATIALARKATAAAEIIARHVAEPSWPPKMGGKPSHNRRLAGYESEIIAAYRSGSNSHVIGEQYGTSHRPVARILRAAGVIRDRRQNATGKKQSPETIEKRAGKLRGRKRPPMPPLSSEARAKISAFHKGRPKSAATRERMRLAQQKRFAEHPISAESRARMSASAKKRINPCWSTTPR